MEEKRAKEFQQADNRVEILKRRAKRCQCKYCGGKLSLKRLVFNEFDEARVELYCESCEQIEYGVEPEIYQSAANFVDNLEFNHYPDLNQNNRTRRMNIAKVCEIMAWGFKNSSLLTEDGFTVSVACTDHTLDQCLILTEDELAAETEA